MSEHNKSTEENRYENELRTDLNDQTNDRPKGMALHTKILLGLLIGVMAGLVLNMMQGVPAPAPPGAQVVSPDQCPSPSISTLFKQISAGEKEQTTCPDMTVVQTVRLITEPVGQLFLSLLLMIVVPLVFSSLVVGVAGIGDIRNLGRIGFKSFAYTIVISALSVVIGLTLANTIKPGNQFDPNIKARLEETFKGDAKKKAAEQQQAAKEESKNSELMSVVKTIVPGNVFNSMSATNPNMLHIMFYALIVGIAITLLPSPVSAPFVSLMESVFAITSKIIDMIMRLAPYAVACLIFNNVAIFGFDLLKALGWFVLTVLLGLGLHFFGVYSLSVAFLSKINPIEFFRRIRTVIVTAFSTSSSNATLPTALRVSEENLGVPKQINSFVLTVGATANQNGTALYEGVTVLFLAQLVGFDLSIGTQLMIVYLAILGGIGTAGVPSGSIPFIIGILAMIGIDPALIAVILGVDRILDMCRTTLNVVGDITAATYVARSEGFELLGADTKKV